MKSDGVTEFNSLNPPFKVILVFCITLFGIVAVIAFATVENTRIQTEAQKIHAEQEIEHDKSRPRKVWEKDPKAE